MITISIKNLPKRGYRNDSQLEKGKVSEIPDGNTGRTNRYSGHISEDCCTYHLPCPTSALD